MLLSEEKRTPKEPINIVTKRKEKFGMCPNCKTIIYDGERRCYNCGQYIVWPEKSVVNRESK